MRYTGIVLALFTCARGDAVRDVQLVHGLPGEPIAGLSPANLERFELGRAIFMTPFTAENGLGPLFNQDRCSSCHDLPAIGGTGQESATKSTRFVPPNVCDDLVGEGGSTIQERTTPLLFSRGVRRESVPPSATATTIITSPSLYGLGLVEAVPLSALERLADPEDANGDGISGRIGETKDGRPARFGGKSEFATIGEFVESALRLEMGITTPQNPVEETLNGRPLPSEVDPAPDPEIAQNDIELLIDFVRFLAPPSPSVPGGSDHQLQRVIERGEVVFTDIGCASCHVPTLVTGPAAEPALSEKAFRLYSDFLLHDLGERSPSICGPTATPSEFRTARLAGVRHRPALLYDGTAGSIWSAVIAHGGEASSAQAAFLALNSEDQTALISFVSSR